MKRLVLVLLGMFILSSAYAVDWNIINDNSIEWVEITNVEKDLNYEPGGCIFVYQTGENNERIIIKMFSSPTTHYIEVKNYKDRTIERWYGTYAECKNFIWQKFEKKRVINNENYLEWKKVE